MDSILTSLRLNEDNPSFNTNISPNYDLFLVVFLVVATPSPSDVTPPSEKAPAPAEAMPPTSASVVASLRCLDKKADDDQEQKNRFNLHGF